MANKLFFVFSHFAPFANDAVSIFKKKMFPNKRQKALSGVSSGFSHLMTIVMIIILYAPE